MGEADGSAIQLVYLEQHAVLFFRANGAAHDDDQCCTPDSARLPKLLLQGRYAGKLQEPCVKRLVSREGHTIVVLQQISDVGESIE